MKKGKTMEDIRHCCPQCKSEDLFEDHLSQKGSAWPVLFGGELFEKKELLAYACKKCGFVFLFLGPAAEEPGKSD
jgi:predicted nucleic-acid-binding Zn-ribbon protein